MKGAEPIFIDKNSNIGVLMLHGFSSTPDEFKELSTYLADKGITVSAPLVAGHGTLPRDLMKTNSNDWTNSVKTAYLKIKSRSKNVFIIGNSFGSNLGIWLTKEVVDKPVGIITLGAPIFLRFHRFIVCRLYSYGLLKKYYRKPPRLYRTDFTDMLDEVTYPRIPTRSLREFLRFIKNETRPNLGEVKVPALVVHSDSDRVINPKSATFIYEHLGSPFKRLYWFRSNFHMVTADEHRSELFEKIYNFIEEVIKSNHIVS